MLFLSNIDYLTLIQILIIFFVGGIVKGLIGVGLPTITLTLLSFLYDIKFSISVILLPVVFTNLIQMLDGKYLLKIFNDVKVFLFSSFIFIVLGFYFLIILNSKIILFFLAIILIVTSSLSIMKYELKIKNYKSKYFQFFIGSMTGIITGVTSIYTMPFIFLIQSLNYPKEKIIQLMGLTFFGFSSIQFILFSFNGLINPEILIFSLISCIPIFIGIYVGNILRNKISENLFKYLLNIMIALIGCLLIIKVIF